jgi:hypothetical protein
VVFEQILNREPIPAVRLNPDIPPKLEDIINRALEKNRNLRYQHASEIRAETAAAEARFRVGTHKITGRSTGR